MLVLRKVRMRQKNACCAVIESRCSYVWNVSQNCLPHIFLENMDRVYNVDMATWASFCTNVKNWFVV